MSFFPPWGLRVQRIGQWNWDQETVSMQWGPVHKRGCLFFFFLPLTGWELVALTLAYLEISREVQ